MGRSRRYTDEDFTTAWNNSVSIAECARKLGLRESGGNYLTLKSTAKRLGLNGDHMSGQGHNRGKALPPRRTLEEILVHGRVENTAMVKRRMLSEGYFERRCYGCGLEEWLGEPIPLELEHINGDRWDNRRKNLTLLCPNCHARTPTYRGRNIKARRGAESKGKKSFTDSADKLDSGERSNHCVDCGDGISTESTRCRRCAGKTFGGDRGRRIEWPSLEDILKRLESTSYSAIARELGVSDNAIRKFIKREQLR